MTWAWLAEHWEAVSTDLHAVFGVDTADAGLMRSRSWRWLSARINAVVARRSVTRWLSMTADDRQRTVDGDLAEPWC